MKASFIFITISSALLLGSCHPLHAQAKSKDASAQASVDRIKTQKKAPVAKSLYYVPVKGQPPVMVKAPAGAGYEAKKMPLTELKSGDYGKVFCPKGTTSVVIPEGVVRIPEYMCRRDVPSSYDYIEEVSLPSTLKSIGYLAFEHNKIKELSLPEGLERIGDYDFRGNELEHVNLPESLQYIGEGAFENNKLSSIMLPREHRLSIFGKAFAWNKLERLVIPKNVELVGSRNFSANELTQLMIEEGVFAIPPFAFAGNQLKSVTLPSTIGWLGAGVFSNYPPLDLIADLTILSRRAPKIGTKVYSEKEPLPDNLFGPSVADGYAEYGIKQQVRLHVPAGATGYSGSEWQGYPDRGLSVKVIHDAKG